MPQGNRTVSQVYIKINGFDIPEQYMDLLQEAVVDQSTSLPHMFILRFRDPTKTLADEKLFTPGADVEIAAKAEDSTSKTKIFQGEITAVEPQFREGMIFDMAVRGYDKAHQMYRQVKSRTFLNQKDSDIARKIAGEYGLGGGEVTTTSTVYDHVFQHNQSDMAFLMERAWRIGFECFVDGEKLYFRKPPADSGPAATLTWGEDLRSFFPSMTLAEQVDEVTVKGWDMRAKKAIVGKATKGQLYPANGLPKTGAQYASSFGDGEKIIVNQPVVSQAEANSLAQARLDEISGVFVEASGAAFRRPEIKAGQVVELKNLGDRFSGKYFVTGARHIFNNTGLVTEFDVRGLRSGLLNEQMRHQEPVERWPGAAVAIVTNTEDPDKLGRVKVKYPWLNDDTESWWARVISPGAGPEAGLFIVPEVDDEVMVIFEQGDFNRPYVLGGVWNGKDKVPPPGASAAAKKKPLVRTWYSRTGHQISVYDTADKKIEISTADGHKLILDDKNKKIELVSSTGQKLLVNDQANSIDMETTGKVTIKSDGPMEFKSTASLKIESGGVMDIKATGPLNLKGAIVNIN